MIGTSAIGAAPLGGGGEAFVPAAAVAATALVARPDGRGGRLVPERGAAVRAASVGERVRPGPR